MIPNLEYIKTLINGLYTSIQKLIKDYSQKKLFGKDTQYVGFDSNGNAIAKNPDSSIEALELLVELEVVVPVAEGDSVLTDNDGNILII